MVTGRNYLFHSSERHTQFRIAVRKILDSMKTEARELEDSGERPPDAFVQKLGAVGLLAANIGPDAVQGIALPGGIKPEEYDYFYEMIVHEEFARWSCPGLNSGVLGGMTISVPTIINFAKPELKAKVIFIQKWLDRD
jgi:alkylation response protein AidB-like acyl-CoA dehydrogenase